MVKDFKALDISTMISGFNTKQIKKQKKKKIGWDPEVYVITTKKLRMGNVTLSKGTKFAAFRNKGYDGKQNLGFCFYHRKKKYCIGFDDCEVLGRVSN